MLTSRLNSRSGASRPSASVGFAAFPALRRARPQNDARSLADGPHTRILVGRLWQDARQDVALAPAAPPQMEQIHAPRAGVRLGVKSVGVPASGTRYPRRQEPTPTREPNPGHFSLPSNAVSGMRPLSGYPGPCRPNQSALPLPASVRRRRYLRICEAKRRVRGWPALRHEVARGQARDARGEPPSITGRRLRFGQMRNER